MREHKIALESRRDSPATDPASISDSVIGDALGKLTAADREAVLLRFVQGYTLAETGAEIGVSEEAARKRVNRALVKLRASLTHGGAALTLAAIAEIVQSEYAQAAPAHLARKIADLSLTHAATSLAGSSISQIAQGAQTAMTLAKVQTIAAVAAGLVFAGGGVYLASAKSPRANRNVKPATASKRPAPDTHAAAFALYVKMYEAYAALKSCSFTESGSGSMAMGMPYQMRYTFQKPDKFNIVITRGGAVTRVLYQKGKIWTIPQDGASPTASRPVLQNYTPLMDGLIAAADVKQPLAEMMLTGTQAEIDRGVAQDTRMKKAFVIGKPTIIDGAPVDAIVVVHNAHNKYSVTDDTWFVGRVDHLLRRVVNTDTSGQHPELNFTVTYSNIQVNPTIPASTFEYTPPS